MYENIEIVPSLLSADFAILAEEIEKVEQAHCKRLHLDVMDGNFVPNITMGPVIIESIRKRTKLMLDAHLMINRPERYLNDFQRAGVNSIIIHQEACCDFLKTVKEIRKMNLVAGVALRPGTAVSTIKDVIREMGLILIMTVEPGFGGQPYMAGIEKKIIQVRNLIREKGLEIPIEVDGGINTETAPVVARAGATRLVAGYAVFSGNVVENVEKLRRSLKSV
ncbi:MAG: ribulose-phosphate 3-epimerase [Elusimicrobiota bacterium]|nr:ribulose-phosphate 3-epimerase [Elusimicrobiota bacterium]